MTEFMSRRSAVTLALTTAATAPLSALLTPACAAAAPGHSGLWPQ
jgi:hypothetical protein